MTSTKEAKKFLINVLNLLEYLKIAMQNIVTEIEKFI